MMGWLKARRARRRHREAILTGAWITGLEQMPDERRSDFATRVLDALKFGPSS